MTTILWTAADLERMAPEDRRTELVRGVLRERPFAGGEESAISGELSFRIANHARARSLGQTYAAGTGFLLARNPDTVLAPSVAFVRGDRLPQPRSARRGFLALGPDLVGLIVAPTDRPIEIEEKLGIWLGAGARVVAVVDSDPLTVIVHRPGRGPEVFREGDELYQSRLKVAVIVGRPGPRGPGPPRTGAGRAGSAASAVR